MEQGATAERQMCSGLRQFRCGCRMRNHVARDSNLAETSFKDENRFFSIKK